MCCVHFYEIYFNKSSFFFTLTQFPKIVANLALMRSLLDIENEGNLRGKLYNFNGLDSNKITLSLVYVRLKISNQEQKLHFSKFKEFSPNRVL